MNILITGSRGLLGHAVTAQLSKLHSLTEIVREATFTNTKHNIILCDLADDFTCDNWPNDIDVIVHMAQSPFYRDFPHQASHVFAVNCQSMAKLLDYAHRIKVKHFIYTSTGSVYEPYQESLQEEAALNPTSFYANSKLIAERLCASYENILKISILRLFFLYGPHPHIKQTLVNNLLQRVQQGQEINIDGMNGGLAFVPTLTYDIARVIEHIINIGWSGTMNLANPEIINIETIARTLSQQINRPVVIQQHPTKIAARIVPDLTRMHEVLKEFTFTSFAEGSKLLIGDTSC